MRQIVILFFLFFVTFHSTLIFGDYPFVASIIVQRSEVRGGPDLSFYPTSILKLGDKVEIYFETNNWCAIRPPLGSFSWVSARHVSLGVNNVGVVLTTGLASRIGSEIVDSSDTVQVKLNRGEKILVMGKMETPENIASPLWFKISPPRGEYRWIHKSAIDPNFRNENLYGQRQNKITTAEYLTQPSKLQEYKLVLHDELESNSEYGSETNLTSIEKSSPPLLLPPTEIESTQPTPKNSSDNIRNVNNERISQAKNTVKTINIAANNAVKNIANNPNDNKSISVTKNTPDLRFDNNTDSAGSIDSGEKVASAVNIPTRRYGINSVNRTNINFQRVFDELQQETVAALTGQTDDWVFVTLIEEANRLYNSARTDAEMEKVYHIIESLKRGRSVRQDIAAGRQGSQIPNVNYNQKSVAADSSAPIAYLTSSPSITAGTSPNVILPNKTELNVNKTTSTLENVEGQYDVTGKLGMFKSLTTKHPPFAVVDKTGRITCLLTPDTNVDLRQYVGKVVGVNGIRGIYRKSGQPDAQHIIVKTIAITEW
ncbi:MAG: hypothetical protein LBB88_10725 [Planctomycetaceae bacterium]|jgi:hypothetical protein|nr:hypothetical protein [Planctomycetaceae bacterium]